MRMVDVCGARVRSSLLRVYAVEHDIMSNEINAVTSLAIDDFINHEKKHF